MQLNREELLEKLYAGRYKPKTVQRVEIPKPDGGKRMLGVPTVIDPILQQAIVQVLRPCRTNGIKIVTFSINNTQ